MGLDPQLYGWTAQKSWWQKTDFLKEKERIVFLIIYNGGIFFEHRSYSFFSQQFFFSSPTFNIPSKQNFTEDSDYNPWIYYFLYSLNSFHEYKVF